VIAAVILAAGESKRLGQPKQLLEFGGETLIGRICRITANSKVDDFLVVNGAFQQKVEAVTSILKVSSHHNPVWKSGLGSSIKLGLSFFQNKYPELEALIYLLVDQPLLKVRHLDEMLETYRNWPLDVVASAYGDTVGVPVLYGSTVFSELMQLKDTDGGKKIIFNPKFRTASIPFPEGLYDLDTMEDYQRMQNILSAEDKD
jgi:molybdenum cofactor cytidylyltransferase